jgi:hypothetical protein
MCRKSLFIPTNLLKKYSSRDTIPLNFFSELRVKNQRNDSALYKERCILYRIYHKPNLKVVGNEKEGGPGKLQTIDIYLGLW